MIFHGNNIIQTLSYLSVVIVRLRVRAAAHPKQNKFELLDVLGGSVGAGWGHRAQFIFLPFIDSR